MVSEFGKGQVMIQNGFCMLMIILKGLDLNLILNRIDYKIWQVFELNIQAQELEIVFASLCKETRLV